MEEAIRESLLPESSKHEIEPSLIRLMYAGHFLARWGARMWEFSVALYMINSWPDSLLFTAIYGVVESASIAIFGPLIGSLVDRLTYLQVLRVWLLTRSLSFVVAGGSVTALLIYDDLKTTDFQIFMVLIVVTNLFGAVGVLSTLAGTILIEREWVVVMSNGEPPELLTKMNSVIRRIDLSCKLLAPVFTGFIISFISLRASAIIFSVWNIVSVLLEYWLLASVYNGVPSLSESDQRRNARVGGGNIAESSSILEESESSIGDETDDWKIQAMERLSVIPCFDSWIVYLKQEVALPGISLAILYFTVLSFGTLMTATLDWKGIPVYVISIARGVSALVGIGATVLYPVVHSRIFTVRTGLWSIWMQWSCLLVCVASIWVSSNFNSAWILMGGVAVSRLGLWMFDLAVMQLMQDLVPESDRCIVGGVQNSLQSMFDLLTYMMGIIISDPKDFGQLIILSFFLVTTAALMYTFYVYRIRLP
ncbi:solute carrier family 40 member 1-like isoform X3 [Carex littledalei]|uniref:Solute carrier family 40 member n=1 Tax=Carex littledalei TaxID=544730 RepID=A0A833VPL5_9POAL|nr:solute carrier family 40 member 1-like isoform X3 [Carex littledalei]